MIKLALAVLVTALVASPSRAAVTYEFSASGSYNHCGTFIVTLPAVPEPTSDFLSYEVSAGQLTSCSAFSDAFESISAGPYPCSFQSFFNDNTTASDRRSL
jgi:hypothetical protein